MSFYQKIGGARPPIFWYSPSRFLNGSLGIPGVMYLRAKASTVCWIIEFSTREHSMRRATHGRLPSLREPLKALLIIPQTTPSRTKAIALYSRTDSAIVLATRDIFYCNAPWTLSVTSKLSATAAVQDGIPESSSWSGGNMYWPAPLRLRPKIETLRQRACNQPSPSSSRCSRFFLEKGV